VTTTVEQQQETLWVQRDSGEGGVPIKLWHKYVPLEESVLEQATALARTPGVERVAILPDAHVGKDACVGSAIFSVDTVLPAAAGVDLGCGVRAMALGWARAEFESRLKISLGELRSRIESAVPMGRGPNRDPDAVGSWRALDVPDEVKTAWNRSEKESDSLAAEYDQMCSRDRALYHPSALQHLGTLGTGNHFLELCEEVSGPPEGDAGFFARGAMPSLPHHQPGRLWLVLHSGSRGPGNKIGTTFMRYAQTEMDRWKIRRQRVNPDRRDSGEPAYWPIPYLPKETELFGFYLKAVNWAQRYAKQSRALMMSRAMFEIQQAIGARYIEAETVIDVHHNYIDQDIIDGRKGWITRKGAIDASKYRVGIVPGSMGVGSYITVGLGSEESIRTSSHGAGRVMARGQARRTLTVEQHVAAVRGIECRLDADVLDESPACYKDLDAVMRSQEDLTRIAFQVVPILNCKG
jgi:tRNA-splicing ligase RtcB (3'-phosphate/5'-hydroxy nucleic acid ligase)